MDRTEKIWTDFSKSINGEIFQTKGTYSNPDNVFKIQNEKVTIDLIWADLPESGRGPYVNIKSNFNFKLPETTSTTLEITPNDSFSKLLLLFKKNKQKSQVLELDKKYIFISNSNHFIRQLIIDLIPFSENNRFNSFVISTSKGNGQNSLNIQVNALLIEKADLEFVYKFGLLLCSRLSASI
ncbi:MAG: hypothetical protein ABI666_10635 [Ferruginibacter sp.]